MENTREKRYIDTEFRLLDNEDGKMYVEGKAISFNSISDDLGGFYETILPEAINDDLLNRSNIICCINHNEDKTLAVWREGKGSLNLYLKPDGLYYKFELGKSQAHIELKEYFERGEINGSSFAFTVKRDGSCEDWSERVIQNGVELPLRKIKKIIGLYDVSVVFFPAYRDSKSTMVERKLQQIKISDEKLDNLKNEILNS